MDRNQKEQLIQLVGERFSASPLVILTDFKGSTVEEMDSLRRACEPAGVHFQVIKNTLCKLAINDTEKSGLTEFFKGNTGVIFAGEDPIAAAKLFRDQAKDNSKLVAKAGYFEGDVLDAAGVAAVAELPSREELLSKLLATLQEAPRQVLGVMQAPARDLLYLLNNYSAKLSEE